MRKRLAKIGAVLGIVGLLAAVPSTAFGNDGLSVKLHGDGKPQKVKLP